MNLKFKRKACKMRKKYTQQNMPKFQQISIKWLTFTSLLIFLWLWGAWLFLIFIFLKDIKVKNSPWRPVSKMYPSYPKNVWITPNIGVQEWSLKINYRLPFSFESYSGKYYMYLYMALVIKMPINHIIYIIKLYQIPICTGIHVCQKWDTFICISTNINLLFQYLNSWWWKPLPLHPGWKRSGIHTLPPGSLSAECATWLAWCK